MTKVSKYDTSTTEDGGGRQPLRGYREKRVLSTATYHLMKTKTDIKYEAWLAAKSFSEEDEKSDGDNQRVPRPPPPKGRPNPSPVAEPEPEEIDLAMAEIESQWGADREVAKFYATTRIYFPGAKIVDVRKKATPQSDVEDETVD